MLQSPALVLSSLEDEELLNPSVTLDQVQSEMKGKDYFFKQDVDLVHAEIKREKKVKKLEETKRQK
jgi:hypothetical protein